jgi:hypothetical protein
VHLLYPPQPEMLNLEAAGPFALSSQPESHYEHLIAQGRHRPRRAPRPSPVSPWFAFAVTDDDRDQGFPSWSTVGCAPKPVIYAAAFRSARSDLE